MFETHSTTTDNEAGVATGWLPGRLSELGRRQAVELGERRGREGLAVVYSSDLRRAVETARLAFPGGEPPLRQDVRLRECDYGEWNGAPMARIEAERARRVTVPFPGGQSYRQVVAAMEGFLRAVVAEWDGRRVLVIGHSATRWALECLLSGAELEELVTEPRVWRPGWRYLVPTDR
ncbi:histidine phosphatase family protein [Kitasatospora sp. MMS16-BH015]|uniref:histidine phosphatase family protein n=1 Tax=Kitasatospora sp. MMS16-BH015 TaxID=2018025 RepID=UPI0020C56A2A|nr:histidine phosphatase family protein [Kitasatospora sp. MMS16-BH015]